MLAAIRSIQPNWVVGENVAGLVNWRNGLVFQQIQTDLEIAGYEVFPPVILPACSVNAPHRRDRLWVVAHARGIAEYSTIFSKNGDAMGTTSEIRSQNRKFASMVPGVFEGFDEWRTMGEPGLVRENDGVPDVLDRIKALGNAVVPQLVYQLFKAIEQTEQTLFHT